MGSSAKKPNPADAPPPAAVAPSEASVTDAAKQVARDRQRLRNSAERNSFLGGSGRGGNSFLGR